MQVRKRNGVLENFDINKIGKAIYKARLDADQWKSLEDCAAEGRVVLSTLPNGGTILSIEEIQDAIEKYLLKNNEVEVFKLFTFYREKRRQDRQNPWTNNDERQDMVLTKYLLENETKAEFIERISLGNSNLAKIFRNKEGLWGGRNLYAIGREGNITGSNCYVATAPKDSLEDIYRAAYEIARTYSYGGGQGLALSELRPKGSKVNNSSNTSPGVMTFAELYSFITLNTQQENRRGALMITLSDRHPDIIDFITAKLDVEKINGANISISVSAEFIAAVRGGKQWTMKFETEHELIEKTVSAQELMELIAYANHTVGDPGFLLIDIVNAYHLLSEYDEVVFKVTNPCGEQPLMEDGSCNLGSINLNAFVRQAFQEDAYFDLQRFLEVVTHMTWGLDELLDLMGERHALAAQRQHVIDWREIGLGVMGLADLALSMGMAYGSKEFNAVVDTIMYEMANAAAQASALRAKELGVFPKYDFEKISNSEFYQTVYSEETMLMIEEYGLRNSRLLSIAPTGSIANVLGVSGGVEPFFMLAYQRIIKSIYEDEVKIWVYERTPMQLMKHLKLTSHFDLPTWAQVTSQTIPFTERAEVQATIQKYVDTAISSTFNIANTATIQDIIDIYLLSSEKNLKGATVFRNGCRKAPILSDGVPMEDPNPAPFPSITVYEKWTDKKTGEVREFVNFIQIAETAYKSEKIAYEPCPECGAPLVKQGGCTKCSDNECYFEKCSI